MNLAAPSARPRPAHRACSPQADQARPSIEWMQDAAARGQPNGSPPAQQAVEASEQRLTRDARRDRPWRRRRRRRGWPSSTPRIATANDDAARLSNETGPALIAALAQVREAGAHAAERARAAIAEIIPEIAPRSLATQPAPRSRKRFAKRSRSASPKSTSVADPRGRNGARGERSPDPADAVDRPKRGRARSASRTKAAKRSARTTARISPGASRCLMDSMHSAAIDVQKILVRRSR